MESKKIQQLDLNLLKVFQALYVEQNMTRAAEVLHITPSAVSHAIKRLRDALDDPLFRRSQNRMLPTPACQRMAPDIIDTLTRLQQILQQWGDFEPTNSQEHFRIGMHDALEPSIVPMLAARLGKLAPGITFSSIKFDRVNLLKELSSGHIELALDVALPINKPIATLKLLENNFMVMMRATHPLAEKLDQQAYLSATHLNVSNRPSGMTVEDGLFREQGVSRRTTIRCQSYYAAIAVLRESDHLLTIPSLLAPQFADQELVCRPMPFRIPSFATHLYWHQNTEQDAALRWLRTMIADLFEAYSASAPVAH
ncbi:MAG: LysR family transcriptional regulator [Pseudomonadota bacterium]